MRSLLITSSLLLSFLVNASSVEYWQLVPSFPDKTKREVLAINNCESHLEMNHPNQKFKEWLKYTCEKETKAHNELTEEISSRIANNKTITFDLYGLSVERGEEGNFNKIMDSGLLDKPVSNNATQWYTLESCINNNKDEGVFSYNTNTVDTTIKFVDNLVKRGYRFDQKSSASSDYLLGDLLTYLIKCHKVYKHMVDNKIISPWLTHQIHEQGTSFDRLMIVAEVGDEYREEVRYNRPQHSFKFIEALFSTRHPYVSCSEFIYNIDHMMSDEADEYLKMIFKKNGYNVEKCISKGVW
jgi:hypothetical protein